MMSIRTIRRNGRPGVMFAWLIAESLTLVALLVTGVYFLLRLI